jgi:hypothetical protein
MKKLPKVPRNPSTEADWRAWLRRDVYFAEQRLIEFGEVRPMFVIHSADGKIVIILSSWNSEEARRKVLAQIGLLCIAHDAIAMSYLAESWLRMVGRRHGESDAEQRERAFSVKPSQAHDRMEVVVAMLTFIDPAGERKTMGAMRGIERDAAGKAIGCTIIPGHDDKSMSRGECIDGQIPGLLPTFRPTPEQRALVHELLEAMGVQAQVLEQPS